MKHRKSKLLSLLLVVAMMISMIPYSAFAIDVEYKKIETVGNQSPNKYLDYMAKHNPSDHERLFNKMTMSNYTMTPDDGQTNYIVFCFNETRSAPNHTKYLKKYEKGTEEEFAKLAEDPIVGRWTSSTYVRNSVLWATHLAYPGNHGVCNGKNFVDRAIDFYHIPDDCAEDAVHLATQMAVWLFTDYNHALKTFWGGDWNRIHISDQYQSSMGDPITYLAADIAKMAYEESSSSPTQTELDLYIPKADEYRLHKQNLLVTQHTEMNLQRNPVSVQLDVRKAMDNGRPLKDQEFSFTFTGNDGQNDHKDTVFNAADGTIRIPTLTFTKPGVYHFSIQEVAGTDPAVEYETAQFPITVTVTGTRDLQASVSYGPQGGNHLVITNKVKLPQLGQLTINKTVSGEGADANQLFGFTVSLTTADGTPLSGTFGAHTFTNGSTHVQVSQAKPVTITDLPAGTNYTVTEDTLAADSNYTLKSPNNVKGTIQPNGNAQAAFLNAAKPKPVYGALEIQKTVKAAPAAGAADHFNFTITLDHPNADLTQVSGATFQNGKATVPVPANGSVVIRGLPAGIGYTVEEQTPDGYAVTASGANGSIVPNQTQTAKFENTYLNTGELTIQKIIEGSAASETDVFRFKVVLTKDDQPLATPSCTAKADDGTLTTLPITNGELELSIKGNHFVTLTDLPEGVHYQVSERKENDQYTDTAGNEVEHGYQLVDVAGNGQNTSPDKAKTVVFTNSKTTATGYLRIFKVIEGKLSNSSDEFGFRITLKKADGSPLAGTFLTQDGDEISFNDAGEAIVAVRGDIASHPTFLKIMDLPVGTKYTVEEFMGTVGDYTSTPGTLVKDGYVLKEIKGNSAGTIKSGKNDIYFVNRKADTSLTIQKTITDNLPTQEAFTFQIKLTGAGANFSGTRDGVTFRNGSAEITIHGAGSQTINGLPECGYTITETPIEGWNTPAEQSGVLSDGTPATVVFENTKIAPVEVPLAAQKTLDGQAPAENQFTFVLKDADGRTVDIQSNHADGRISFAPLSFHQAGTYTYTISEEPGMDTTISYDSTVYTATVRVDWSAASHAWTTQVTYQTENGDPVVDPTFANTTIPVETTSVTVHKVWQLDDGGTATNAVTVALLKDGVRHSTVELSEQNGWTHTWAQLEKDSRWSVEEVDVPQGFQATVTQEGQNFTITNDDLPTTPTNPEQPETPTTPSTPNKPEAPTQPVTPNKPEAPHTPTHPVTGPQTGDSTPIALWMTLGLLGFGGCAALLLHRQKRFRHSHTNRK